jgi:hypothetical protein
MDHFVARENIKHLQRQLENGAEPGKRATMLKLLVEEENRLGFSHEQLGRLEHHISQLAEIMARQVELTDGLRLDGHSVEQAEMVLATLNDLMASCIAHRQRLRASLW